jgi:hypothetical protein
MLLNKAGLQLDVDLITAGGLVHDLAKGKPHHAPKAGRLLFCQGFTKLAGVVAAHMELDFMAESELDEKAVVFLADKLVKGERLVTIEERFSSALDRFSQDDQVMALVLRRKKAAETVMKRVLKLVGNNLNFETGGENDYARLLK